MSHFSKIASFKRKARKTLFKNYAKHFLLSTVGFFVFAGFNATFNYFRKTTDFLFDYSESASLFWYFLILSFFLAVPIVFFIANTLVSLNDGTEYAKKRGFFPTATEYKTATVIYTIYLLIFAFLVFLPVMAERISLFLREYAISFETPVLSFFIENIFSIAFLLSYVLLFMFSLNFFLMQRICLNNKNSVKDILKLSFLCMKGKKLEFILFNLSFTPLLIISYFIFPLFIFYTLPYYLISLDNFSKCCIDNHNAI